MGKFSIKLNFKKVIPFRCGKYDIKKTKHHTSMQRTLSTAEITNKTIQQVSTKSSENIALASRTVSHNAIPPLLNNSSSVDFIIGLLDMSKVSIEGIKDFFKRSSAKYWAIEYVRQLQDGKILPMPCMAQTTEKMKKVIADLKGLYEKMAPQDSDALTALQSALDINAHNGYPAEDSELLAKIFCVLRDLLVLRYGEKGDPQWPKETGVDFSISNFGKSKEKLLKLEYCSQKILLDNFPTSSSCSPAIHSRYPFYDSSVYIIEQHYQNHRLANNSVRILSMDDFRIEDFNRIAGLPITYLGLLGDTSIARHDNFEFLSYPFLMHDGHHAYFCSSFNNCEIKSIIHSVMNEYYYKLKPALNYHVAQIVEYMFFETLHETPDFFDTEKNINIALSEILIGFGIIKDEYDEYSEKYLTNPLLPPYKPTKAEAEIINHLLNKTATACHAVRIYKHFTYEAASALKNKKTCINKLTNRNKSTDPIKTMHTIESLTQMVTEDEKKWAKTSYFDPLLKKLEEARKKLLLEIIAHHKIMVQ